MTNYVQDAMRTMSDNWHGVSIAKSDFLAALILKVCKKQTLKN